MKSFDKLKAKLAELFQLDQADLDFGIYRIMNAKREEITRFLEHDLLPQVREAFAQYKSGDKAELQKELEEAIQQAKALGADPDTLPKVKELRERLEESVDITALENEVYDHLYNFFSRYYDEGDFISLRRYKEGVYAIPYEGEGVKLYWANHDQYYIKTTEYFRDYAFRTADGRRVRFKIAEADTEKDNIKAPNGKDRRFFLHEEKPVAEKGGELVIRFEYRPDPEKRKQADINARIVQRIVEELSDEKLASWQWQLSAKAPTEKSPNRTVLEKHLSDYTKRNTFDYFIHKDLGKFLRRELDFYIKNEVMHLDDVENESAPRVEQYLSKIKVIRRIAHKIIDFLAQIENFQKKLWLKKKFVVETNYCMTLDRVPEEFYPEIAANDAQREEWVRLFAINEIKKDLTMPGYSEPLTVELLKANPHLVLDTRHFSKDFKLRLIAAIEDIDEQCDGLLVHSENFQALNLMLERYREQVKCVYIDPPYNTGDDGFLYKDNYQSSSWLSFLADRLVLAKELLTPEGAFFTSIGNEEVPHLRKFFDFLWGERSFRSSIIIRRGIKNVQAQFDTIDALNQGYEYVLMHTRSTVARFKKLLIPPTIDGNDNTDDKPKGSWNNHWRGTDRPTMRYPLFGITPETGQWRWGKERSYSAIANYEQLKKDLGTETPSQEQIDEWVCQKEQQSGQKVDLLRLSSSGKPEHYVPPSEGKLASDLWTDLKPNGSRQLLKLFGNKVFDNPKSVDLVFRIGEFICNTGDEILDFFAGSGTTAHAVINLNREDNGKRKYILVEMGDYFDTVLLPRIKKVVYSKDWKDGKPVSRDTGISHMFKYIRLESYEDALANIELKRTGPQQLLLDQSTSFRESYMLKYMLETEAKGSPSLLNIDWFDDPFNYKLLVGTGSVGETKAVTVDLVETFNWLLGLRVRHMDSIRGFRIVEGTNPKGEKVLIIWRKIRDLSETDPDRIRAQREQANRDLEEFFRKQQYNTLDSEFDVIYVNGDNNLMNIPLTPEKGGLEPRYKVRLIEEEFRRLMFDVKDV
ncbi:MAG: site-specific DNA-methyltransferase [Deltaproteobacteria bacterium]|nr:MAG: site-specific DNA-methyltransferase [Deltaproteobacteria bacterium]